MQIQSQVLFPHPTKCLWSTTAESRSLWTTWGLVLKCRIKINEKRKPKSLFSRGVFLVEQLLAEWITFRISLGPQGCWWLELHWTFYVNFDFSVAFSFYILKQVSSYLRRYVQEDAAALFHCECNDKWKKNMELLSRSILSHHTGRRRVRIE